MRIIIIALILINTLYAQVITQQNILQGVTPLNTDSIKLNEFIFDRVIFEDNVYSNSKKTELGDQSRLNMAFRYHTDLFSFARIRFSTDPSEDRYNNKTSRFEAIFSKRFKKITFQIDLEILTDDTEDDTDSSGTSLGLDTDSDDTFINIQQGNFLFTFYPFNFRSDVGDEFNTLDVSRINTVNGSPTTINATPVSDEKIITKSIPGLEIQYQKNKSSLYAGLGVATYLYPTNGDFDIEDNQSADAWERKETAAYKAGFLYFDEKSKINIQYVGHQNTEETGALLKSAGSINLFMNTGNFITEFETTMSQAGEAPYDIDRTTNWFNNQTPFLPIFSDRTGEKQDWINKVGYAYSLKIGLNKEDITPYLSLKYQDEYFIFDGDESAHRLRNNQEDKSHGGLERYGIGAYFYYDNIYFNPQIEYQKAQNPVFTNATDLRDDREISSFTKENTVLTLSVVYTFDGSNKNQTWWF